MDNVIKGGADPKAWMAAFELMTPVQRRWAFIAAKMAEHKQTFTSMATRHRLTAWYLGACAQGKFNMAPSAVKALESDLHVDLSPFLSPTELRKAQRAQMRMEEEV
jgi:hypothetical protein